MLELTSASDLTIHQAKGSEIGSEDLMEAAALAQSLPFEELLSAGR